MSKEEALNIKENGVFIDEGQLGWCVEERVALEKMDEYAKQESIEFIKWAIKNYSVSCKGFSPPVYSFIDRDMREIGADKLYELYQQYKINSLTQQNKDQ